MEQSNLQVHRTLDIGCAITNSDHGVCSITMNGGSGTFTTSSTNTESFSSGDREVTRQVVTITAGAVASTTTSAASTTSAGDKSSSAASKTAGGAAEATSSSTAGAVPMMTRAPWAVGVGGVAALAYAGM